MRIPFLVLLLAETYSLVSASCPVSCVVCSEDAIICHKLSTIVSVPNTTQAMMLTNGWIDHVDHTMLSSIGNLSVLGLSNNAITRINENAFQNLIELKTLLLDHNFISSQTLKSSTLSWLPKLETLLLGNNVLQDINGCWFQNSTKLKILRLEGNELSTLNSSTFSMSDLSSLETLDLSENFITHVGQNSFRNLPQLRTLDLSRNRLEIISDAFSYLPMLSELNLDLNSWKCSCELHELASFLRSYTQSQNKVLYNGQKMMCVSANNPAVKVVLELTDANCAPPNRNNTMTVKTRSDITAKQYSRDISLVSILFFAGGVLVTLAVMCITHKLIMKKGSRALQKESKVDDLKHSSQGSVKWKFTEEKELSSETPSVNPLCVNCANHRSLPVWDKETPAIPNHVSEVEPHFTCQSCASAVLIPSMAHGKSNQSNGTILHLEGSQTTTAHKWPVSDERLLHTQSMLRDLFLHRQMQRPPYGQNGQKQNPDILYQGNARQCTSGRRDGQLANHSKFSSKCLADTKVRSHGHPLNPTISCMHCHTTLEHKQSLNQSELRATNSMLQKRTLNYNQSGLPRRAKEHEGKTGFRRNVTFDLTESAMHTIDMDDVKYTGRSPKYCHKLNLNHVSAKFVKANVFERYSSSHTCRIHSRKPLKVKLNLNPLRKGKVHPNSSPRHNKDNPKNMIKMHKHKLKAKVTRHKDNVEQRSPNISAKGQKLKNSKDSAKPSSEESSQLKLHADGVNTEATVCTAGNKNQGEHENQTEPAVGPKTEEPTESKTPSICQDNPSNSNQLPPSLALAASLTLNEGVHSTGDSIISPAVTKAPAVVQEYLYSPEGSPKRKIRLIMPEKTANRPTSALDKKIR